MLGSLFFAKAYLIETEWHGVHYDTVFLEYPSEDDLEWCIRRDMAEKDTRDRPTYRVMETIIQGHDELLAKFDQPDPPCAKDVGDAALSIFVGRAKGIVTIPNENK